MGRTTVSVRLAAISDVHSNLEALSAVLHDIDKKGITEIHFTGDAVGYGPDPNKCIEVLINKCRSLTYGNHDEAALDPEQAGRFNEYARLAVRWTAGVLNDASREALRKFSLTVSFEDIFLVHSTPCEPGQWHYLMGASDAKRNFDCFDEIICLLGHSHRPLIVEMPGSGELRSHGESVKLQAGSRYIINIGSVGQPRDGDPRACYAVVDDESVELVRVRYDIEGTQAKMREAGLPGPLIERLAHGR